MEKSYDAIIVGGGPAGLSAAIYMARARFRVLVIEKEKVGGQITITSEVVNYPGIIMTDGEQLTGKMRQQAENFGAEFLLAEVTGLDLEGDYKTVHTDRGILRRPASFMRQVRIPGWQDLKEKMNSEDTVWHTARPATANFSPARIFLSSVGDMQRWKRDSSSPGMERRS